MTPVKLKLGRRVEDLENGQVPSEETLADLLKIAKWEVPEGYVEVETYPLKPPFSYAHIVQNEDTAEYLYVVDVLPLGREEREAYLRSKSVLERELKAPLKGEELAQAFQRQLPGILNEHKGLLRGVTYVGAKKVMHYLERDVVGLGKIDPLMFDPYVEDISCSGANRHIFLWHRRYENIKTSLYFEDDDELDDFVMKIVHKSGRHISVAFPMWTPRCRVSTASRSPTRGRPPPTGRASPSGSSAATPSPSSTSSRPRRWTRPWPRTSGCS